MSAATVVVSDKEIAAYREAVGHLARRFVGVGGAEEDDLVQEGLIAVWKSLARGIAPSSRYIQLAMLDWARKCRLKGLAGYTEFSQTEDELARLEAQQEIHE